MKNTIKRIIAALLTVSAVLSVPCLAFAAQTDTEQYQYIEDAEVLIDYFAPHCGLLRIKADENISRCFGRIEFWDRTQNKMIWEADDSFDQIDFNYPEYRGFINLSFDYFNFKICRESDYYIRIPADAFYEDLCDEYSIPVPAEDVIFSLSGENLFSEDFDPFIMNDYSSVNAFGYYGDPEINQYSWIDFGKELKKSTRVNVYVSPAWSKKLTLEADNANVKLSGSYAEIKHYDGRINFSVNDSETGNCYDKVFIDGNSDLRNAPSSFGNLLASTVDNLVLVFFSPITALIIAIFGTGFGALVGFDWIAGIIAGLF